MGIFISEWLKTKRTPVRMLTFFLPFLLPLPFLWYFSRREITLETHHLLFQAFFEVWTALVIPLGAGLLSGLLVHQEELAGRFGGFLINRYPRRDLYLGKLTLFILLASVSTLLATLILVMGFDFISDIPISYPLFFAAAIMAILGSLPLLAFHLWVSFAWGMGASIGIGGGGMILSALMATNLGNSIWPYVPWGWPIRLTGLTGAYLLYVPGMKSPPEMISSGFIRDQMIKGLVPAVLVLIAMVVGGVIWFQRWEGRKAYE